MKYLIILMIFFNQPSFAQTLGKLYYSTSERKYIAPPIREIKQLMNNREKLYYQNRDYCNQIENLLIEDLQSLRIDSINTIYREGLKRNLNIIQRIKSDGDYAEYSILLMDIMDNIKNNDLYYEDEEEYSNDLLEKKLRKQEEETQKLKKELEYQKSLNAKPQVKKKIIKK
jgi:hypothetical protein